jgi:predicted dehydrogenase
MKQDLNWGILSTAKIGTKNVIPAIQQTEGNRVVAISSRSLENAQKAAKELDIEKAYSSYDELLEDPDIDVIYNPLPNHLHVSYTVKALTAGKHVLCEKPISVNHQDANDLLHFASKFPHLKVMEAFMYRFHPQWEFIRKIIDAGEIGEVRHVHSTFTYFNNQPDNIKNQAELGGGSLLDIGCYCVNFSRFIFQSEPIQVQSMMNFDPVFNTDRFTSALLTFKGGSASFLCGMQINQDQRAQIYGSRGKIEISIPFNDADEIQRKVTVTKNGKTNTHFFEPCNQYELQIAAFSNAIRENKEVPIPLSDAVSNMDVITKIFTNYLK